MKSILVVLGLVLISALIVSPPTSLANVTNTLQNETISMIPVQLADFDVGASYTMINNFAQINKASFAATMLAVQEKATAKIEISTASAIQSNRYSANLIVSEVIAVARNGSSMSRQINTTVNATLCDEALAQEVAYTNRAKPTQASASVIDAMEPKTKTG